MTKKVVDNGKKYWCVLGILDTEKGRQIAEKMRLWLFPNYNVIEVYHDGSQFEYPSLKVLHDWCVEYNQPCLYVHTRGAFYHHWTTPITHKLWEREFCEHQDKYFAWVDTDKPTCACPFTSEDKHTFYNGFVVNAAAMRAKEIEPSEDRFVYEDLFKDTEVEVRATKVIGTIKDARMFLKIYNIYN